MKTFDWPQDKNAKLKADRNISFEKVVWHIENGDLLDIIEHPNPSKYPNQKIYIVNIDNYVYCIPFVESDSNVFLKTIFPSRKLTSNYFGGKS